MGLSPEPAPSEHFKPDILVLFLSIVQRTPEQAKLRPEYVLGREYEGRLRGHHGWQHGNKLSQHEQQKKAIKPLTVCDNKQLVHSIRE